MLNGPAPNCPAPFRPRRSCLYMPGGNERALEKARSLPCDVVIMDLEDAVAPEAKADARARVVDAVNQGGFGHREVVVRINGLDTEWGGEDMATTAACGADALLVPKITSPADIVTAGDLMADYKAPDTTALWVMIEMPLAILNIGAIAAMGENSRLAAFVMGTNDIAKELRATPTADRAAFQMSLNLTLLAARAHGLIALDGVYNDIGNPDGLRTECVQGLEMGFDGKTLIHPSQIEPANAVFSPDPDAVEHARAVIEAFAAPENAGKGVLKVAGKMTELLHLEQARRLVAINESIASRSKPV